MAVLKRLAKMFHGALDRELDAELRAHIEMRMEQNIAEGMTPEEARRDALRRFGNRALVKEDARRFEILPWMESVAQDARYALRSFRRSPVFTLVAIVTLTLGIGGNMAIFTLTHALMWRSLPVRDPGRLVEVTFSNAENDFWFSGPMFDKFRERNRVFDAMFAWTPQPLVFSKAGEARKLNGALASGDAFQALGVEPLLGRVIVPEDDQPGGGPAGWAAVLSYDFWKSHFNGDPGVIGRTLTIEQLPVTIVGVLPRGFDGVIVGAPLDLVLPLDFEMRMAGSPPPGCPQCPASRRNFGTALWLSVMGRMKPGVTMAQVEAEMKRLGPPILKEVDPRSLLSRGFFKGAHFGAVAGGRGPSVGRNDFGEQLLVLQGLVGIILLICCANLAGLMLARSSARQHEFALRSALGAGRFRILRQLWVESLLVAIAGAAGAIVFARWAGPFLLHTFAGRQTLSLDLAPDTAVLLFTAGITVAAAFLLVVPSGLRSTRIDPMAGLKNGAQTASRTHSEMWLVAGQVGLAAILLVAAGLLTGTLRRLLTIDPGFSTSGVLLVPTDFGHRHDTDAQRAALYEQMIERLDAMPGVEAASVEAFPMAAGWLTTTKVSSKLPDGSVRTDTISHNIVGPQYFAAVGARLLAGRDFSPADRDRKHPACILNRSAGAFFFPGQQAVGESLRDPDTGAFDCEVVGLVDDMKFTNLRDPAPRTVFRPVGEQAFLGRSLWLVLRTSNTAAAAASARSVLRELAPGTPLLDAITVKEQIRQSIGRERAVAAVALFFGALGLLLAAIGVYGLLTYQVIQRTREIGVRMALGAARADVLRMVLGRAVILTVIGMAVGLSASAALGKVLASLLFEIKPRDPLTYGATAGVLLAAALLAAYVPARRAMRVDPMVALRHE